MKLRTLIVGLVITGSSASGLAAELNSTEIQAKVAQLNDQSVKLLGVSLNALRYLVDADPNSYLLHSHLENSGELKFIRELETKGYVRTQTMQGLPDGSQKKERFLRIIPQSAGMELQRCVLALQHNNASQPTR